MYAMPSGLMNRFTISTPTVSYHVKDSCCDSNTFQINFRSRARWYEEGERSSKYFLSMEKRNHNNKCITRLKLNQDIITEDQDIISNELKKFYQNLYTSVTTEVEDSNFFKVIGPKLSDKARETCEGPINEKELLDALKACPKGKTPGNEGFPVEFYLMFWEEIKEYLLKSINAGYELGRLSITQRQGVITLLPKKDKDPLYLKNWRPISLLNTEYKLVAKCLANRIIGHLDDLIHSDQTGFLPGRYIGENINKIFSLMQQAEINNFPALLLAIDFEKAYDYLERPFIEKTLDYFGFGASFILWVKTLYNGANSTVINNGWMSENFKISRGVRQGCPLSPYIFVLSVEILALNIRQNEKIKGIKVNNDKKNCIKIIQYADDTCLPLAYEKKSLEATLKTFEEFKLLSGLKVNYDKTEILRIGSIRGSQCKLENKLEIKWSNDYITLLGVKVTPDWEKCFKINICPIIDKIKNLIGLWSQRDLSVYGKITIVKSFLTSQLVYMFSVLPSPDDDILIEIETILYKFIWSGKPDKIKRNILIGPLSKGGLKMVDIREQNTAIKASWVKRWIAVSEKASTWRLLAENNFKSLGKLIWDCNLNSRDIKFILNNRYCKNNSFWIDVIRAWSRVHFHNPKDKKGIMEQVLWMNSHIIIGDGPVFLKLWNNVGINYVHNLLGRNGQFLSFDDLCSQYNFRPNILTYLGLLKAIPNEWKKVVLGKGKLINQGNNNCDYITVKDVVSVKKCTKYVYEFLIQNLCEEPTAVYLKWNNELNVQYDSDIWSTIFLKLTKTTKSTKLRYFQYRILHRILPTNIHLKRFRIKETDLCSFCGEEQETYLHLFVKCDIVKKCWKQILEWLNRIASISMVFNDTEMVLGLHEESSINYVDMLLLTFRHFIYFTRCKQIQPSLDYFLKYFIYIKDIEKHIAVQKCKMKEFRERWMDLDMLEE